MEGAGTFSPPLPLCAARDTEATVPRPGQNSRGSQGSWETQASGTPPGFEGTLNKRPESTGSTWDGPAGGQGAGQGMVLRAVSSRPCPDVRRDPAGGSPGEARQEWQAAAQRPPQGWRLPRSPRAGGCQGKSKGICRRQTMRGSERMAPRGPRGGGNRLATGTYSEGEGTVT